ncbi:MAG: outer membrane protein [Saprospiraceae bacterium]|nr:MAG: outer membrane protein [Saprospiraceae bacterium]
MKTRLLFLFLFISFLLQAQTTISGIVIDAVTKEPLPFANIKGEGTTDGTNTEADGIFKFQTTADVLVVSYLGYRTAQIGPLKAGRYVEIALSPTAITLNAVAEVVGIPSPVALQTLAPIATINGNQLARDNEVSITPALNRIAGVFMHSGSLNTNRITIRGIGNRSPFSTTKIRAYLDDIPLTTGVGETTIEDIDLSLLDQVQVWKGPTGSTYGAGLGGMIHLQTKSQEQAAPTSVKYTSSFGSYGLVKQVIDANPVSKNGHFNVHVNYANLHSDGYRDNNEYDRETFTILGKAAIGPANQSTAFLNYTKLKAFIPSSLNLDDYKNNPSQAAFTWGQVKGFEDYEKVLIGLSNASLLFKKGRAAIRNTTSLFTTYRSNYESTPFNILRENNQAIGARTKFTYDRQGKSDLPNLTLGGEVFFENYNWQTYATQGGQLDTLMSDNQERRRYFNLFVETHYELGNQFFTTVGVNLNQTHYTLRDFFLRNGDLSDDYTFDLIPSPRLGLGYHLHPRVTLFATVSHGFSPPTLEETLAPDGSINPDIQPEKGWNFEIGSRGKYLGRKLSFDVSVYTMKIKDLLVARRTAQDQFVGINAGKTTHNGLEAYLQYHVSGFNSPLSIFASYAYSDYRFDEFVDGENDYSGNDLTGTPPHLFSAGIDYRPKMGFYGNINFQYTDALPLRDDNSVYSKASKVMNAKIGYFLTLWKHLQIDLHAGINNLLDEKYASMFLINAGSFGGSAPRYYYPGLPRNYYGGISLKYSVWGAGN